MMEGGRITQLGGGLLGLCRGKEIKLLSLNIQVSCDYLPFTSEAIKLNSGCCFSPAADNGSGLKTGIDENEKKNEFNREDRSP